MLVLSRRRLGWGVGALAAFFALSLLVDWHVARTVTRGESTQWVSNASHEGPAPAVGPVLRLQVAGAPSMEQRLQRALKKALGARGLPFTSVELVQALTDQPAADPFLLIDLEDVHGFWTPVYGSRQTTAVLSFAYGVPLSRGDVDALLTAAPRTPEGQSLGGGRMDRCPSHCATGQRRGQWSASAAGLVGLPYMHSLAAERLASEAAALVQDTLPENYNPAKWGSRAFDKARQLVPGQGGMSFHHMGQCRGGLLQAGGKLLIYEADTDRLTEPMTLETVLAQLSAEEGFKGLQPYPNLLFAGTGDTLLVTVGRMPDGQEVTVRVPLEGCKLGPVQAVR